MRGFRCFASKAALSSHPEGAASKIYCSRNPVQQSQRSNSRMKGLEKLDQHTGASKRGANHSHGADGSHETILSRRRLLGQMDRKSTRLTPVTVKSRMPSS